MTEFYTKQSKHCNWSITRTATLPGLSKEAATFWHYNEEFLSFGLVN